MAALESRDESSTTITSARTPVCSRTLSIASARKASPSLTGKTTLTSGSSGMRRASRPSAPARERRTKHPEVHRCVLRIDHSRVLIVDAVADERRFEDHGLHARVADTKGPVEVLAESHVRGEQTNLVERLTPDRDGARNRHPKPATCDVFLAHPPGSLRAWLDNDPCATRGVGQLWMLPKARDLALELARLPDVVVVEESDHIAARGDNTRVAGGRDAPSSVRYDPGGKLASDRFCAVG